MAGAVLAASIVISALSVTPVRAAAPLESQPADLTAPFSEAAPARLDRDAAWAQLLAQRALEAGMYHLAEGLFQNALARTDLVAGDRRAINLGLATTLLGQSRPDDARQILEAMPGEHDAAWELRQAVVDFLKNDRASLATRLAAIAADRLPPADVAWLHFLRAMQIEGAGADAEFADALASSTSAATTAWFRLAEFQGTLNADRASEASVAQLAKNMEEFAGRPLGYEWGLQYAAALERLGRRPEAVQVLSRQRRALPANEIQLHDKTLLLLGLVAGVDSAEGYEAFRELLEQGATDEWQRIALQRLADAAISAGGLARVGLPRLLDSLLSRVPPHALTEDLLYYRAALALRPPNPALENAEDDANRLLTQYPGSALGAGARALLASSSWQRGRYRTAADHVTRLRADAGKTPRESARLAVLAGECYYQAGENAGTAEDYRNAAESYATAQDDIQTLTREIGASAAKDAAGLTAGTVFFQRVLSLIRGGSMDAAAALLESPAAETIDPESRWQAAWNYVRFLQLHQRSAEAFRRLEAWGATEKAPVELRLKFLWLAAQLTLETGQSAETEARVRTVQAFLAGVARDVVPAAVRAEVESNAALLLAQAQLDQKATDAGIQAMNRLRDSFPNSKAAIFSFIIEARYLSEAGQLVEAQRLLKNLADNYPKSDYAARALFEAAELAKKRGQDAYLWEANNLLETLATNYPEDDYVFMARLEQGDILRRLNRFAAAEQVYLSLENNASPNHPLRNIAQLSLADALMAQVPNDSSKFDGAISRLERLTDLPGAEPDLRIEAGFKLGAAWQNHGDLARAGGVFWDVYQTFLGTPRAGTAPMPLGPKGNYWIARALLELGGIEQKASRLENARHCYELILKHGLPGDAYARGKLAQLQTGG